jgi:hypothetical protein
LAAAPEKFPHEPFDPIPNHRVAYFAADGNTEPSLPQIISFANNDEIGGMNLPTVSRESQKFGSLSQAGRFRKVFLTSRRHPGFKYGLASAAQRPLASFALLLAVA